ncbi:MAG: cytochrome c3 family protein [Acidobacteria bacterium]|nr:cytochrome c3 family protein [Acidobacteriota bacterium]
MTNKIKNIKFSIIILFSFLFIILFILPNINLSLTKAFSKVMPSIIILDDPDNKNSPYAKGEKPKAPFDHDQHISTRANTTCVTCHHTNSNDLSIAIEEDVPKCTTCHTDEETTCKIKGTNAGKDFSGKTAIEAEKAFHGRGSDIGCIGCHDNRGIEPKGCLACHTGKDTVDYVITPLFPSEKDKLKPLMPSTTANKAAKTENAKTGEEKTNSSKESENKPTQEGKTGVESKPESKSESKSEISKKD